MDVPLAGEVFAQVMKQYPGIETDRIISEAVRRLIGIWITDLVAEFTRRAAAAKPASVEEVRALSRPSQPSPKTSPSVRSRYAPSCSNACTVITASTA